ncbi:MAG: L-threonylcarbamoyladenylate synthase [Bacteroidota bacterium]
MESLPPSKNIPLAAQLIREGKLVAFPTETVYGLGANALDPYAVAKIFEAKERPSFDPLIVHIADLADVERLTSVRDERIQLLAAEFWPGPLTMVLPKSKVVPDIVTSGLPTVGIRMPNHPMALDLIRQAQRPIAAPSANKFGRVSPTQALHVTKNLPAVDLVLDGGPTTVGIESTIIRMHEDGFEILRHGAVTRKDLERIVPHHASERQAGIVAPGMLKSHYSPNKPLHIFHPSVVEKIKKEKTGLLAFSENETTGFKKVIQLTSDQNLKEYAVNLFAAIHKMEANDEIETILVEPVPEEGIGIAIMDRVRKAAYEHQVP